MYPPAPDCELYYYSGCYCPVFYFTVYTYIVIYQKGILSMNRLSSEKRAHVISTLVEGTSINGTCRITGVAKHTALKLLKELGCAAASYHDAHVRNLRVRRVQADEIWVSCTAKTRTTLLSKLELV